MSETEIYTKIAEETAKDHHILLEKQNEIGVASGNKVTKGLDTGEPCITVFVTRRMEKEELSDDDMVDDKFMGYKTDVVEIGEVVAGTHESPEQEMETYKEVGIQTLRQRIRPVMGGFSVGHYRVTAGTIATCAYPLTPFPGIPQRYFILSNNHVIANSNNARFGDPALQPGRYDGGTIPRDIVARLYRWVPIHFKTPSKVPINYVDAAIAQGEFHNLNREIYWIGYIKSQNNYPKIGQIVQETGRTTNFSTGKILALHATIDVNYGGGKVARFRDQLVTTRMSAGGDSGSLVCDTAEGAVGLLFAGSPQVTIANRISYVKRFLGIRLHP